MRRRAAAPEPAVQPLVEVEGVGGAQGLGGPRPQVALGDGERRRVLGGELLGAGTADLLEAVGAADLVHEPGVERRLAAEVPPQQPDLHLPVRGHGVLEQAAPRRREAARRS
jgi:hypothetical protein